MCWRSNGGVVCVTQSGRTYSLCWNHDYWQHVPSDGQLLLPSNGRNKLNARTLQVKTDIQVQCSHSHFTSSQLRSCTASHLRSTCTSDMTIKQPNQHKLQLPTVSHKQRVQHDGKPRAILRLFTAMLSVLFLGHWQGRGGGTLGLWCHRTWRPFISCYGAVSKLASLLYFTRYANATVDTHSAQTE
jgi:hypothetical protein